MKKRQIIFIMILLLAFNNLFAATERSRQLAEEILALVDTQKLLDQMALQIKTMRKQMLLESQHLQESNLTDEQNNDLINFSDKMTDLIFSELSWEKMKDEYIKLYTDFYTEGELQQLLDFYKTPVGQKTIQKLPEINQKSMEIVQEKMKIIMPKINQLGEEYGEKLRQRIEKRIEEIKNQQSISR